MKSDSAIAERAYAIWQEREANGLGGTAEEDWDRAEQEVRALTPLHERLRTLAQEADEKREAANG